MNNKPYTQEEFVSRVRDINPNIVVLGEYTSSHSNVLVQCKKCGLKWSPRAYRLIQGSGCPECGKRLAIENRSGKTAKKTLQQFTKELSLVNQNVTIIGEYTGSKSRLECSCNICGYHWTPIPYRLLRGAGCPNCYKIRRENYRWYTPESFAEKLFQINSEVELLSPFTKSTEVIEAKCKNCGHIWFPKAYSLLQGRGCPKCAHRIGAKNNRGKTGLKTIDAFREELAKIDDSIEVIGDYSNTHTDIACRCDRCGHRWSAKPYSLLQGHGCPRCAKSGTSFMEQMILLCMQEAVGSEKVLSRDKSQIGMELDIYIPELRLAIEPGNWYLHKRSLSRDSEKRRRCHDKGIRLVTIYDKFPQGLEPPYSENCYVYSDDLNKMDHSVIQELIYDLFAGVGIDKRFSEEEWKKVEERAYDNSRALTHEDFVKRLHGIRPDILVLGKYENANRRIYVKCATCGFSWYGVPANLLRGDGCRKCGAKVRGNKERRKQEDFERDLKQLIPTISVIGTYISRHKPIRVQCLVCGNKWEPTPGSLLRKEYAESKNNGCPLCARRRMGTPRKKVMNIETGEVFISAVEAGEKYNTVPSAIRQCCRGKSKSSNGYHWKYID